MEFPDITVSFMAGEKEKRDKRACGRAYKEIFAPIRQRKLAPLPSRVIKFLLGLSLNLFSDDFLLSKNQKRPTY